jgi:hypothetical protein
LTDEKTIRILIRLSSPQFGLFRARPPVIRADRGEQVAFAVNETGFSMNGDEIAANAGQFMANAASSR